MKALILAGGYGTRLRPLTYTCPKPMLPLAGKPVLHHTVELLSRYGLREVIITTNYLRDRIEDYFGDGSKFGIKILYAQEDAPLGTAGSVKNAEKYLDDDFVVIQGDNVTDMDLDRVLRFHKENEALATIALIPVENPSEYGIADLDGKDRIVRFLEKPRPEECFSRLANTGLYVFAHRVLDYIPEKQAYDFSKELFPKLLQLKEKMYGCKVECFWADVGQPVSYLAANEWIMKKIDLQSISEEARIEDAIIKGPAVIEENVVIGNNAKVIGPIVIKDGSVIHPNTVIMPKTVIGSNVEVGNGSKVINSLIYEKTRIGSTSTMRNCIVGEQCKIGSSTRIGHGAIIGANCKIGDNVKIQPNTRIWPDIEIDSNSIIKGFLRRDMTS